ncbi:DUF4102 domain-containing protein [Stutzerimonas stutzeri]|nr:DUF4102 domain-containing protein [Stutzerimonas stutzeri]
MALSDTAVRQAKPAHKDYTISDSNGLALLVHRNGSKYWTFSYSYQGKRRKLSLGVYPHVSLKRAREKRDECRIQLADGLDPSEIALDTHVSNKRFREVADEWDAFRTPRLTQGRKGSAAQARRYLDKDILPVIGEMAIADVRRSDILRIIRAVEERGALNVAEKVRTWLHQIFRYAMVHEYVEVNPATDLDIVAAEQPPVKHNPWLKLDELGEFVRTLRTYQGSLLVRLAVELMLLTGVRTAEIRQARHEQFDLEGQIWSIPASSVKQLRKRVKLEGSDVPDYLVPLSSQAVGVVRAIQAFTRQYDLLLPGRNDPSKVLSENTLNTAIKRMGYGGKLTGHGIRGTLSTAFYEMGYPSPWIEAQLSHADDNKVRGAYNHALYVDQRRDMMQRWADYLDLLAATTTPFDSRSIPRHRP